MTHSNTSASQETPTPVRTRWIELPAEAGAVPAFLATPPSGQGPGILLLQEIFGVNPHIRSVAEQYALAGFTVLAPELFWRQQARVELGYEGAERDRAMALMRALDRDLALKDLQTAAAALRASPACNGRVAALGYCMGGRLAFVAAARAGVDAAVAYYGGGIVDQLAVAPDIRCPVQFHHAGQDHAIPAEAVERLTQAMRASPADTHCEFHLYPAAQHGFNCWARSSHLPASAALALGRTLQFLSPLF